MLSLQILKTDCDKTCGPDGISSGVFEVLSLTWLVSLTTLFNNVFSSASDPVNWSTAKLFTMFKRGSRCKPRNYRGISVLNSINKL